MADPCLTEKDLEVLRCPTCGGRLAVSSPRGPDRPLEGEVSCPDGHRWPVIRGLLRLFEEAEVQGNDKLLRAIYTHLAPLHDPAVTFALPICGSGTEGAMRGQYIPRLGLRDLEPRPDGRPLRILEIGMGTGANVSWVRSAIPRGLDHELWGVDLAEGMLKLCRRRLERSAGPRVRMAMADAHALPFDDDSFDRVFHVGATNNYRDPDLALAEMARVAAPGSPIVVVDERLDPAGRHTPYHRLMYRLVTFYEDEPRTPVSLVPPGAESILDEQIARFFYCLTFRMPAPEAPAAEQGVNPLLTRRRRRRQRA